MIDKTEEFASIHLGKKSLGSETYDNTLLVAIPRSENRKQYNIQDDNLPFYGFDIWHAYEFSTLTEFGIPITRVLKLKYNCNSKYLVESKSLKLYLNSFNMSRFGKTPSEALDICKILIEKDLSQKLETEVNVNFLDNNSNKVQILKQFKNIMNEVNEQILQIKSFNEAPEVLEINEAECKEYYLTFDSLRSNCRVTHQPDFGDVFIYYKSKKHITETSLIKYLCSFRNEFHFHEECVEMIFKRIQDLLNSEDELFICALYTRRGGIDISPIRRNKNYKGNLEEKLIDITSYARYGIKQ
ncbi:NADPH-dependent 7-cyano-7-deazaguanine reductase QueF [bacterium]|nr:NADPH-dependent 7-cyano-7-deazaguanine reductase QueF [bacterium]